MGTSSAFGGQLGGSLIPSWLGGEDGTPVANPDLNQTSSDDNASQEVPSAPSDRTIPQEIERNQFTSARTNFTGFASSGGADRAKLGRAVSRYIASSTGGAKQAAQRMGTSRSAGANLARFLSEVRTEGIQHALNTLNLSEYVGRPIEEVFLGLADFICPVNGTIDEGIARSAFIETIIDMGDAGITDLNLLSADQMQTVMELYITHTIEARLCNDIGTKITIKPDNIAAFEVAHDQLHDFLRGGVSDALTHARADMESLTFEHAMQFIDSVYEQAFGILQTLGEKEANR